MAGRLLPVALATIAGVSIGIATFGREFEKLQRQRLEKDYQHDVVALSPQKHEEASPSTPHNTKLPKETDPLPESHTKTPPTAASFFGTWAWKKQEHVTSTFKADASIEPSLKQSREN